MQLRYETGLTGEEYVRAEAWLDARLARRPPFLPRPAFRHAVPPPVGMPAAHRLSTQQAARFRLGTDFLGSKNGTPAVLPGAVPFSAVTSSALPGPASSIGTQT